MTLIPKYCSKNFSVTVENDTVTKEPLAWVSLISYEQQIDIYNKLKDVLGDIYNETTFVKGNDEYSYKAISPHIKWELLCNLDSLETKELGQLIDLQKKILMLWLKEWFFVDFYGGNHTCTKKKVIRYPYILYNRIKNPLYSTNVISSDNKLYFIDTVLTQDNIDYSRYRKYINFILILWNFLLCLGILSYKRTSNKGKGLLRWSVS